MVTAQPSHFRSPPEPGPSVHERGARRLGVAFPGDPADPRSWSGIPFNLCRALEGLGLAVAPLDTRTSTLDEVSLNLAAAAYAVKANPRWPPAAFRPSRHQARERPAAIRARSRVLAAKLRQADDLAGVLQIHAQCPSAAGVPMATYEDLTVVQAVRHGYPEFASMTDGDRRRRIAQQGMVYERAAACCTTTSWARRSLVDDYGVSPERVHVVGIGANRSLTGEHRDWTTPRFLFVGNDWTRKNGEAVCAAFVAVRSVVPDAQLDLVGNHPAIRQEGVIGHGLLHLDDRHQQARLDDLYGRATCFVMPSRVEPSAVAYVEAATAGIPSIGTLVGGSAELIGDGGVVVDPFDSEGLVRAMLRLADAREAAELGGLARTRSRMFTWDRVAERIVTALRIPGFD